MVRRSLFVVMPLVPLALALSTLRSQDLELTPAIAELAPNTEKPGGIRLRNARQAPVEVELRTGTEAECDHGRVLGTKSLLPERTWTIRSSQPLCFRQTGTAGPGEPPRGWQRKTPNAGTIDEVTL